MDLHAAPRGGGQREMIVLCRRLLAAIATTVAAICLMLFAFGPQPAGAQAGPTLTDIAIEGLRNLGLNCNAYTSGHFECSGYNADNIYIHVSAYVDSTTPQPTTVYVFDPYTGRSVHVSITALDDGNVAIYATDSELGTINLTDGWFSVFYPTGNPFSAAVHDPSQVIISVYADSGDLPTNGGPCPHRICPIEA